MKVLQVEKSKNHILVSTMIKTTKDISNKSYKAQQSWGDLNLGPVDPKSMKYYP